MCQEKIDSNQKIEIEIEKKNCSQNEKGQSRQTSMINTINLKICWILITRQFASSNSNFEFHL